MPTSRADVVTEETRDLVRQLKRFPTDAASQGFSRARQDVEACLRAGADPTLKVEVGDNLACICSCRR